MNSEGNISLNVLTVKELLDLCSGNLSLSRGERCNKDAIIGAVMSRGSDELITAAFDFVKVKDASIGSSRKREREGRQEQRRVVRHLDVLAGISGWQDEHDVSHFMDLPTVEDVKNCYRAFYEDTGMRAVEMGICAVCAREVNVHDDRLTSLLLTEIPNAHRLIPKISHPDHDLFGGKLLDPMGVVCDEKNTKIQICHACFEDLKKKSEKPPKYSLANNLWIGKVPWLLEILTFPEQLLLAKVFPRVYVFKLYPKDGSRRDPAMLQRGMKGTVSSFEMDNEGVASMVSGRLLPHPPAILASIISVTFIGVGSLPKRWLHNTFRVRRKCVGDAICWLKANNTKYYGSIDIDMTRIANLPEDDVPVEITSVIRQSEDIGAINQEHGGYVPDHSGFFFGEHVSFLKFNFFSVDDSHVSETSEFCRKMNDDY